MNIVLLVLLIAVNVATEELHLTTDDAGYVTVIQGFATQLQCVLNSCSDKVTWYKDDILLFNHTSFESKSGFDQTSFRLNHKVDIDASKGCMGECVSNADCEAGHGCVDQQCCACSKEDFSLILTNLTFEDSGRYKCQLSNQSELLEFQVEVLESGLKGGFHENISYDHSQCCEQKGISSMCKAMCKPSDMGQYAFDPTSCKTDDYKNFLSCATDGGKRSHVHCCKTQMVPSFCYDFCSGDFQMLRRSHRLCLYYLPEIFECYNRAYLPYPDPPEDVTVNAVEHNQISVCWKAAPLQPSNKDFPVQNYTVFYKQIPNFPLFPDTDELGFEVPFLEGADYGDLLETTDDDFIPRLNMTNGKTKRSTGTQGKVRRSNTKSERPRRRRDEESTSPDIIEFAFEEITTNQTCALLTNLRSATRYALYVIATNEYGQSVPSLRSITSTNVHVLSSNTSLPNSMECCKKANVSDFCASMMCDATVNPSVLSSITISTSCRHEWPKVSPCIADGRNHSECCTNKKVQSECLPICAGSTSELSVHSILCLNLDLNTIYTCLREGYETHPSSPINVTVDNIGKDSALVSWESPTTNSHLVVSYTIFIRKNKYNATLERVENAVSPHVLTGLDNDMPYAVSVQSDGKNGKSLPSTTILFRTRPALGHICARGEPLLLSDGRPVLCDHVRNPCPVGFGCSDYESDSYCCPQGPETSSHAFSSCCEERGLTGNCLQSCSLNSTSLPTDCVQHLNTWVQCGSGGHDHSRCCEKSGLSKECHSGCRHPFQVDDSCLPETSVLMRCFSSLHSRLPSTVQNIQLSSVNKSGAVIHWMPAKNADIYEVQLFDKGQTINRTNTTSERMEWSMLIAEHEYSVRVISFNVAGSSPPSWNLTFATLPENDIEPSAPIAPRNIRISWNEGSRVNVTWDPVTIRRNGKSLTGIVEYTLSYVQVDNEVQWTNINTNNTWIVMGDLVEDALYSVYVTAKEGGVASTSSAVISILAQKDLYGLPEPELKLLPDRPIYDVGEKVKLDCSVDANISGIALELRVGDYLYNNDPNMHFVIADIAMTETVDTISCAVAHSDGRQNAQMVHVMVKFGPITSMEKPELRVIEELPAKISCTVKGFPSADVHFEKDGLRLGKGEGEHISIRVPEVNTYEYTLHLRNSSARDGNYSCIADRDGISSTSSTVLVSVSTPNLPEDPLRIFKCCASKNVSDDCLQACSLAEVPQSSNCSSYSDAFILCAADGRDHTRCCSATGVPRICLKYCSGNYFENMEKICKPHAFSILRCSVLAHERSPAPPHNIAVSMVENGKIKITWNNRNEADSSVYYAVYYKNQKSDNDFQMKKSMEPFVELEVETGESYDIGLVSVNAYGYSAIKFLSIENVHEDTTGSSNVLLYLVLIFVPCLAGLTYFLWRRGANPLPFQQLFQSKTVHENDPTVAFENPGFNSEVDQEVSFVQASSNQSQPSRDVENFSGMQYSKLRD